MSLETELKVLKKALVEKEKDIHDLDNERSLWNWRSFQTLHPDDKKGSRCKKCKNSPTEKEALKDHVSAAHAANASVQTKEEINNYLAMQAQDSYKMPKTFEG